MRLLGLALLASCVEGQDGIILGRLTLFDQWFRRTEHTRAHTSRHTDGKAGPDAPEAWTVRSKRDVVRGELIYNKAKRVRRGTTVQGNVSVVLKGVGRHDVLEARVLAIALAGVIEVAHDDGLVVRVLGPAVERKALVRRGGLLPSVFKRSLHFTLHTL